MKKAKIFKGLKVIFGIFLIAWLSIVIYRQVTVIPEGTIIGSFQIKNEKMLSDPFLTINQSQTKFLYLPKGPDDSANRIEGSVTEEGSGYLLKAKTVSYLLVHVNERVQYLTPLTPKMGKTVELVQTYSSPVYYFKENGFTQPWH